MDVFLTRVKNSRPIVVSLLLFAGEFDDPRGLPRAGYKTEYQENDREDRIRVQFPVEKPTHEKTD
jgi:hypothetical protein